MDEIFWHEAPAAVWRGHLTVLQGKQRNAMMYGMPAHGGKQLGGVNGGVILIRPSHAEFENMMEHLNRYKLQGARNTTFSRTFGKTELASTYCRGGTLVSCIKWHSFCQPFKLNQYSGKLYCIMTRMLPVGIAALFQSPLKFYTPSCAPSAGANDIYRQSASSGMRVSCIKWSS